MKKLYTLFLIVAALSSQAQSTFEWRDLDNGNALVSNNQVFNKSTTAGGIDFTLHFGLKNVSASTHTFVMRKFENLINTVSGSDMAEAFFCFNTYCYISTITSATIELAAGESFTFYPKLNEASQVGESNVTYEFSHSVNGSDVLTVELRYNAPVSVKENAASLTASSGLYPNPSVSHSYLDLSVSKEINGSLKLHNSLGALVSDKQVRLAKGKNTLAIDTENLNPGIYFVTVSGGSSRIVKKLTITK